MLLHNYDICLSTQRNHYSHDYLQVLLKSVCESELSCAKNRRGRSYTTFCIVDNASHNVKSPSKMEYVSKSSFVEIYDTETQNWLDKEFDRVGGQCYLDHSGSTLYSNTQIKKISKDLLASVYPNPHSAAGPGHETLEIIERTRYRILDLFNASTGEYNLVFTSGATASLKIIAETFKFSDNISEEKDSNGHFVHLQDNHTSVLGMRDLIIQKGAKVTCLPHSEVFDIFHKRNQKIDLKKSENSYENNSLFVYPAQSNFSGFKYPLHWIEDVKNGCLQKVTDNRSKWYVLLDAASFVGTNVLDLSIHKPDFVCLSFYKMFGYPSGIGALIVKNSSANVLEKIYYGGGSVNMALSSKNCHIKRDIFHQRFEDGTLPFLSIIALQHGLDTFLKLPMEIISSHVFSLSQYLYKLLITLHHSNGNPVVKIYADSDYNDKTFQGGIVTFNILKSNGDYAGYMEVLHMAALFKIHLRTGCFCNPGACQRHLNISNQDILKNYDAGYKCGGDKDLVNGKPTGAVRISFGYMSKVQDINTFMLMIRKCFLDGQEIIKVPSGHNDNFLHLRKNIQKYNSEKKMNSIEKNDQIMPVMNIENIRNEIYETNGNIGERKLKLSRLFIYPIKSCAACEIKDSWILNSKGLQYDREWMIMTSAGICLTQKHEVNLCLLKPTICLRENLLKLNYPGMPAAEISLDYHNDQLVEGELCRSRICGHRVEGIDCGSEISEWLSLAFGRPNLKLIRQSDSTEILKNNKLDLSFSSQAQFLMINESSISWLNERIPENSDCEKNSVLHRFRGNMVVTGARPFEEENWRTISIGRNNFEVNGPCTRCQMVCIDQLTGMKTVEPLRLLAKEFQGKMKFGIYLTRKMEKSKLICINDSVICM